jgi:hypothetical protein
MHKMKIPQVFTLTHIQAFTLLGRKNKKAP